MAGAHIFEGIFDSQLQPSAGSNLPIPAYRDKLQRSYPLPLTQTQLGGGDFISRNFLKKYLTSSIMSNKQLRPIQDKGIQKDS
jgi:hypothetical protein